MAELLFYCDRTGTTPTDTDLETVADRILPENAPRDVDIIRDDGLVICTINAPNSLPTHGTSAAVGRFIPPTDDWHKPGAPTPDGSYGIVRTDEETVELVSDATASRTIYYRHFENRFVASTSQRAIAHFADDFVLDETAIAWMISSGNLGPSQAWDKRVGHVNPDTRVRLDRATWEVTERTAESLLFDIQDKSRKEHYADLSQSIGITFGNLDIEENEWVLALSGGMDSRGLIENLYGRPGLTTITWGTADAVDEPNSDAVRAMELAEAYGLPHQYYQLPQYPSDVEAIFERFVTAGEGRIDHISGYLDGFQTFRNLSENATGIIRGNNPFGWSAVSSGGQVRQMVGGQLISDYETLPTISIPGTDEQHWPPEFEQAHDESLATWRDRLKLVYRLAKVQSALTSLKTPYLEEINPFLTKTIIRTVFTLPDDLRTEKRLYHEYVRDRSPDVPVATQSANPDGDRMLASEASRTFLRTELDTDHARSVLGDDLVGHALDGLAEDDGIDDGGIGGLVLDTIKRHVGSRLPKSVVRYVEAHTSIERPSYSITAERLAFRLYIVQSMDSKLRSDVKQDNRETG